MFGEQERPHNETSMSKCQQNVSIVAGSYHGS